MVEVSCSIVCHPRATNRHAASANKKTNVAEPPEGLDHVGSLCDFPAISVPSATAIEGRTATTHARHKHRSAKAVSCGPHFAFGLSSI
jgi:hypothetical protein